MRIRIEGSDLALIAMAAYAGAALDILWLLVIPVVVSTWFINPRWDRRTGWRFKR